MKIQKTRLAELPWVYSTAEVNLEGKRYLVAASEGRGERAYIIDAQTLQSSELWIGDTGVMNVVQIPGRSQLLAITGFYPVFQSREAAVCLLEPTSRGYLSPWRITRVLELPFCHRIGIVQNPHGLFLIGCQLCADKDFQEDWTKPGAIWAAPIPQKAEGPWEWSKVFEGLTKNHGLFIENGHQVYIGSGNGLMLFDMAHYRGGERLWPKLVSTTPTSDLWIAGNGEERVLAAIEPFHGNTLGVYRLEEGSCEAQWKRDIDFGHVVWAGRVFGEQAVILGNRGGEKALELVFWQRGETVILDRDAGPTQITVYEEGNEVRILCASHAAGEVCLYTLADQAP